jgi:hypothetical protein
MFCIVQNDGFDWRREASKMATIYERSQITIAVSSSRNALDPFLITDQKWKPQVINPTSARYPNTFKARTAVFVGHHSLESAESSQRDPLDYRGWALQERDLSTRLVAYTSAELQWKCRTIQACESSRVPKGMELDTGSTFYKILKITRSSWEIWQFIVEGYSARRLTRTMEKLPATAGLAMKMKEIHGSRYFAGLLEENLQMHLTWRRSRKSDFSPLEHISGPSFSWASIPEGISSDKISDPAVKPHTKLVRFFGPENPLIRLGWRKYQT